MLRLVPLRVRDICSLAYTWAQLRRVWTRTGHLHIILEHLCHDLRNPNDTSIIPMHSTLGACFLLGAAWTQTLLRSIGVLMS